MQFAACMGVVVSIIAVFKETLPSPVGLGLSIVIVLLMAWLLIQRLMDHIKRDRRASPWWWAVFTVALVALAGYFHPALIARALPGLPVTVIEHEAVRGQVEAYLTDIDKILALPVGHDPVESDIRRVHTALTRLSNERAVANLRRAFPDADDSERFADLWAILAADDEKRRSFIKSFREGYGDATRLEIIGTRVEPISEHSPIYQQGYRYYVHTHLAYRGRYLIEREEVRNMSIGELIRGLREPDSDERETIAAFLHSFAEPMNDEIMEAVCTHLLGKPIERLRNDDKWERAYSMVIRTLNRDRDDDDQLVGRIRDDAMQPARERISVRYAMREDRNVNNREWLENRWRIGSSHGRLLTRVPGIEEQ